MRCIRLAAVVAMWPGAVCPAPPGVPWDEFQLIMWQDQTPARLAGLARLGFSGAKLNGSGGIDAGALAMRRAAGLPYYVENIATDFYAPYHRWRPGIPVTALFDAAKARLRQDPADTGVFVRAPSLSDPTWQHTVVERLSSLVTAQRADRPLFYNLGDETGIGDLAAAWDADISPPALVAFRTWLRTVYADVPALNRQWGTAYENWDAVAPELTDAALRRTDGNFSAWEDFKAWSDAAFAGAVRMGTDAVHAADPAALAALEGGQVPGWGGYDYSLLAGAVDLMEVYDAGNAAELAQAFNPALIQLRTSFGGGPRETHAAWHSVLHHGRGIVVWDEANDVLQDDGAPGPRGRELQSLVAELRAFTPQLWQMHEVPDAVGVLYSQASFRVQWLLDRQAEPGRWWERDAEREYDDNSWRAARRQLTDRLAALAITPTWLSRTSVEQGALRQGLRVLILPHAIALSDGEVAEIGAFQARGGVVLADVPPGAFDGHGRRRATPPLTIPTPPGVRPDAETESPAGLDSLAGLLRQAQVVPPVEAFVADGQRAAGVVVQVFSQEGARLVAVQTVQPFAGVGPVTLRWPVVAAVTDALTGQALGRTDRIMVTLDPVRPTVLRLEP